MEKPGYRELIAAAEDVVSLFEPVENESVSLQDLKAALKSIKDPTKVQLLWWALWDTAQELRSVGAKRDKIIDEVSLALDEDE